MGHASETSRSKPAVAQQPKDLREWGALRAGARRGPGIGSGAVVEGFRGGAERYGVGLVIIGIPKQTLNIKHL